MRTSRFIRLSNYCVVEYQFDQLGSLDFYTDDFVLLENSTLDLHQIVNKDGSYSSTKNILDVSAVPISNNSYVYLDSEKVPNYLDYDSNITSTDITGYNVVMDKVRYHFITGFDFDKFKGLILTVKHLENDGKNNLFSSILLSPDTSASLISFNSKPLFLGNSVYDRYIDILVPSIKNINEDYKTALVPSTTFVAAITPNSAGSSTGFIYNNQLSIGLAECEVKKTLNTNVSQTYDLYEVSEFYEASLPQTNEFDDVGAYIDEASDGDYIEFYLTYDSGFPADLISILNSRNPANDWIIIHQLNVFEQIGSSFNNTSKLVFFQQDNFDEPNIFRPVLKNANLAVSMSIDYLVRLTNQTTGEQIIREASYVLISPKKYGKKLNTIKLNDAPQSQRVYNKIIKKDFEATKLFIEPSLNENTSTQATTSSAIERVEYVPVFFNNNNISISNVSSLLKTNDSLDEVIFSLGKLRFIISPFDNIIKLKVYTLSNSSSTTSQIPLDLNVNASKYRLVFETDSGKVSIDNSGDSSAESLQSGILTFNISKKESENILKSKTSRQVYLISVSQTGKETLIYFGEWRKPSEQEDVNLAIEEARESSNKFSEIQTALDEINQKIASTELADEVIKLENLGSTKGTGIAPVVNRFGVKSSSSIQTNTKNTKS